MNSAARLLGSLLLLIAVQNATAATWYVKTNGNDGADGTTWATAKQTIQAAVDAAGLYDTVLVSNGVYNSGGASAFLSILTNRVYIQQAMTVRSMNGPTSTVIQGVGPCGDSAVRCACLENGAVLSGFTLANGNTRTNDDSVFSDLYDRTGGGFFGDTDAVLSNCIITGSTSFDTFFGGGGAYGGRLYHCTLVGNRAIGSSGTGGGASFNVLYDCTIISNTAAGTGGGGGAYASELYRCTLSGNSVTGQYSSGGGAAESTLVDCTLTRNSAGLGGGGSYGGTLSNCTLTANSATDVGGGMEGSTLFNCILSSNTADGGGGAYNGTLYNCALIGNWATNAGGGSQGSTLFHCTLAGNTADWGGGVYDGTLYNCVVYFNTASLDANHYGSVFTNCCTTPLPPGAGNITNNPQFVNAGAGNVRLSAGSLCIDAGNNTFATNTSTDLDGNPRILHRVVDMGAYEFQHNAGYWAWAAVISNGLTNYTDCSTDDGYANLLKYATASSATNSDSLARLRAGRSDGRLTMQFARNTNSGEDVTLVVETANAVSNGAPWTGIATNRNGSWGGNTNVTESGTLNPVTVTLLDIGSAGQTTNCLLRLNVSRP